MPTKNTSEVEQRVLAARGRFRDGLDVLGPKVGVVARTVSRILRRHAVPYLRDCDPMTGDVIRSSKHTAVRYEHGRPGELVHMNVKKLGKIPPGAAGALTAAEPETRAAKPRAATTSSTRWSKTTPRLAYSEILPDEKGPTCAGFLERAAAYFASKGIARIERVMTDNALAFRQVFTSNEQRTAALAHWIDYYNTERHYSASEANPQSAGCYQPVGREQLVAAGRAGQRR